MEQLTVAAEAAGTRQFSGQPHLLQSVLVAAVEGVATQTHQQRHLAEMVVREEPPLVLLVQPGVLSMAPAAAVAVERKQRVEQGAAPLSVPLEPTAPSSLGEVERGRMVEVALVVREVQMAERRAVQITLEAAEVVLGVATMEEVEGRRLVTPAATAQVVVGALTLSADRTSSLRKGAAATSLTLAMRTTPPTLGSEA